MRGNARDRWIVLLFKTSNAIAPRAVTDRSELATREPTRIVAEAMPAAIAAAACRGRVAVVVLEAEAAAVSEAAADAGVS